MAGSENILSAYVFMISRSESLGGAVLKFTKKDAITGIPGNHMRRTDQAVLQHRNRRLSVIIKKKLIDGERRLVVEIGSLDL